MENVISRTGRVHAFMDFMDLTAKVNVHSISWVTLAWTMVTAIVHQDLTYQRVQKIVSPLVQNALTAVPAPYARLEKYGQFDDQECQCNGNGCDILNGDCTVKICPKTCTSCDDNECCNECTEGRYQQTEETNSGSVIGGAVGGVLGVCIVVALVVVVLVLKKKGIVRKENKKTYEDISPGRSQDEPYTTLAVATMTEYEISDSEPRSETTIEGEDNRVYYNDERAYYKNIGGNIHKT
ncbi:hypothetical protein MAR_030514 [Mya arenaria]|uniref:Uncharacterized protein n=1 Tax=Mya arenaria TaxID=6604 RepID=A0ABY7F159_MYAAR|nr:hypothetical protein MAR_030514 [Mya arenaria]